MENHLANLANKTANPIIIKPANITTEQAKSLNLVKTEKFVPGAKFFDKLINQRFAIVCYVPAKGAKPNEDGDYGFMKVRGTYSTEEEAKEAAIEIVKTQDQLTKNIITRVGCPFPIRPDSNLPEEFCISVDTKDSNGGLSSAFRNAAKIQKDEEEQGKEDVAARLKKIKEEYDADPDPVKEYAMLRNKMPYWCTLIKNMEENIKTFTQKIKDGHATILEQDVKNPDYREKFMSIIREEEESVGFKKGVNEHTDKLIAEKEFNILNYQLIVPHLFECYG
jgi:hypothetical protein